VSKYDSQIIGEGRLKTLADQNDPVTGNLVGFGGRGFSIHNSKGDVIYDSGNLTEEIAAELGYYPDGRSDDKGTEPETVEYFSFGKKKDKRHYIAVALERCFNNGDDDELERLFPSLRLLTWMQQITMTALSTWPLCKALSRCLLKVCSSFMTRTAAATCS